MNTLLQNRQQINLNYYREQIFDAVHVGDFVTGPSTNTVQTFTQQ